MRARGEGSVYRAGDGWVAALWVENPAGGRKRLVRKAKTQKLANAKLAQLRADRDAGVITGTTTVRQWLDTWMQSRAGGDLSPRTLEANSTASRLWIVPHLGDIHMAKLTVEDVQRMHRALREAGYSQSTVAQAHRCLSAALNEAVRRRHLGVNVAALARTPSVASVERAPALTEAEVIAVLLEAGRRRMLARVGTAIVTGARQGEVLGLTWADVDLDSPRPLIRITKNRARGKWAHGTSCSTPTSHTPPKCPARIPVPITGEPKTPRSKRDVPIPAIVVDALREHRARVVAARLAAGNLWVGDAVFPGGPLGGVMDTRNDHRAWRACVEAAIGHGAGTHAARRTAITAMLTTEHDPTLIAKIVGHASLAMLSTYSRPSIERQAEALERVAAGYGG